MRIFTTAFAALAAMWGLGIGAVSAFGPEIQGPALALLEHSFWATLLGL